MVTLRESIEAIIMLLRENSSYLGVDKNNINIGIAGQIPDKAPSIIVFYELGKRQTIRYGIETISVFCGFSNKDYSEAAFKSLELADKCRYVLFDNHILPIEFDLKNDSFFSNISWSLLEFDLSFKWIK